MDFKKFLHWDYSDIKQDVMWKNEVQANKTVAVTMVNCIILMMLLWVLKWVGLIKVEDRLLTSVVVQSSIELLVPSVLCFIFKGRKRWIKYVLLIGFVIVVSRVYSMVSIMALFVVVMPVVLSCRYCRKRITWITGGLTALLVLLATIAGPYLGGWFDIADVPLTDTTVTVADDLRAAVIEAYRALAGEDYLSAIVMNDLSLNYVPNFMMFMVIMFICLGQTGSSKKMVESQAQVMTETARIESELTLATDIQSNMLPNIYPAFPNHDEFNVYATMNPAKEVGGDFYDYFMLDEKKVCIVVGDVSGKGVPAALFMVITKTLIKDHTQLHLTPAEVFTKVNRILCDGNKAGLFVTAWMGVLDIEKNKLTFVNAGHNPPLMKHKDGGYEFLKSKPGFVLAGMETTQYRQNEIEMLPGDKLFLYTDGVTEATNEDKQLYGEERLKDYLNTHTDLPMEDRLKGLQVSINDFVGSAPQFDDITMLALDFDRQNTDGVTRVFPATTEELENVLTFVNDELEKADCTMKVQTQLDVAVEELFVNVAHYAYGEHGGTAKVNLFVTPGQVRVRIMDSGVPFNPLDKEDPDVTESADERAIGGLGIFMVKKTMDELQYEYTDNQNCVTLIKKW